MAVWSTHPTIIWDLKGTLIIIERIKIPENLRKATLKQRSDLHLPPTSPKSCATGSPRLDSSKIDVFLLLPHATLEFM